MMFSALTVVFLSFNFIPSTFALPIPPVSITLRPSAAPGGNFDLSKWELQLPTGSQGSPTTVSSGALQGKSGFQDGGNHFFTESGDGALVMKVPGSPSSTGCVTTPNSLHCRTELREVSPNSWSPNGSNKLTATLKVMQADNSGYGTVIGQVHMADNVSTKPVCELYYNSKGDINIGVEQTRGGGDEVITYVANVPVGETFTYTLDYSNNVLKAIINGESKTLSTFSLDAPESYFKAGNYNQGESQSDVHFYSLDVQH